MGIRARSRIAAADLINSLNKEPTQSVTVPSARTCILCREAIPGFKPYSGPGPTPVTLALEVIGSDKENFWCPNCECHDRERHLVLYFNALDLWSRCQDATVLHFAPEVKFGDYIRERADRYIAADLVPTRPDMVTADITSMDFQSESFDIVIANHVLEHVEEDRQALSEIFRVLRPGGFAVLQTPFTWKLDISLENASIRDPDLRLFMFGELDHVRVYGKDLFTRMTDAGFEVAVHEHAELLPSIDPATVGVNGREPFISCQKPIATSSS